MQEVCKKRFFSILEENHGGCRDQQNIWARAADEGTKFLKFSNVTKRGHAILSYVKKRNRLREHPLIPRCSVIIFSISQKESVLKNRPSIFLFWPPMHATGRNKFKQNGLWRFLQWIIKNISNIQSTRVCSQTMCEGWILYDFIKYTKVITQNKTKLILRRSGGNFYLAKNLPHTEIILNDVLINICLQKIWRNNVLHTEGQIMDSRLVSVRASLTSAGRLCRHQTPPSSDCTGSRLSALCPGWPSPSGSYTAPPNRHWSPDKERRTSVSYSTTAAFYFSWLQPHLEFVFNHLSLFIFQLEEHKTHVYKPEAPVTQNRREAAPRLSITIR